MIPDTPSVPDVPTPPVVEKPEGYYDFNDMPSQFILLISPGDGVVIESYDQVIIIKFNGYVKRLLSTAIQNDNINDYDIYLATVVSMVLGTDYVYQTEEDINWDMDRLLNRYPGLITEDSNKVEPVFIEAEGSKDILLYETDYFNV